MDQPSESLSRQSSQIFDNVPSKGAQLLAFSSNFSSQLPNQTPHKQVKLSNRFKRLLALAIAIGLLALILIICSCLSPQWERIEFIFEQIIQRACSKKRQRNWNLAHVILDRVNDPVTRFDNQTRWETCNRWAISPPTILGLGIFNGTSTNSTVIEIFNILGGAFQVCYDRQAERGLIAFVQSRTHKNATSKCFNYVFQGQRLKNSGCRQMTLRMQNNLIACIIIVFLCIASSAIVGAVGVLARMVPAALVNAFLYLTACKLTNIKLSSTRAQSSCLDEMLFLHYCRS
ncbi:hypothetical protein Aperf_G00000115743 [Anoplocephala perfoliata]